MDISPRLSGRRLGGILFLLGCLFETGGVALFTNGYNGGAQLLPGYLLWERGLIAAAAATILLGFVLLAAALRAAGEHLFSWIGLSALTLGTALTLYAEWLIAFALPSGDAPGLDWLRLLGLGLVTLIFVGQAAYGTALLRTVLLPHWIGWLLIIWNLAWLAVVVAVSGNNPYYPALFYPGPLLIGLFLLRPAGAVRALSR